MTERTGAVGSRQRPRGSSVPGSSRASGAPKSSSQRWEPGRFLEIRQTAKLLLDLSQDAPGQGLERPNESSVVDRAALIDHNLAVFSVPSHPSGDGYAQEVLTGETCRAGQDPGRWMPCVIQQVRLNEENGPELSSFGAPAGAEIGGGEESPADLHHSSRPSEA